MPPKKRAEPAASSRAKASASAGVPKGKAAVAEPESESVRQMKAYEQAIRLFREQQLEEARPLFEQAASGPAAPVAHNARLHLAICQRRSQTITLAFHSPDEHYNYAVERINAGNIQEGRQHLLIAQKDMPNSDDVLYALAACDALSGDVPAAYENLKRAIDINPRNRMNARQDPDFTEAARNPLLQQLLNPDKTGPF